MNNRQSTNQSTNQDYFLYVSQDKENLPLILERNNGVIMYPDPNDDHGSSSSGHRLYKACLMINGELSHEEVNIYSKDLPQDGFIGNEDKNYADIIKKVFTHFNIKVPASINTQCALLEHARNHESKRKAEQERAANQAVTPHLTASEAESFDEEKNESNSPVEYKQNSVMPKVESLDDEENELKSSYSNNNDEYKQNSVMPEEKNPALSRAINYQICAANVSEKFLEIYIATIRVLLEQHADPNYIDENGNSLLHNTKSPQLITLLLEFGADPKILNSQGLTPIQTAIELNLYDCALTYGKARLKQEELDLMLFRLCNHFNYVCGRTPHKFIQQVLVMGANPNCNPTLLSNDNCWKFGDGIILSFLDHGINIENKNFSDNYGRRVFQNLVNRTRFDAAAACLLLARNTELPVEVIDRIGRYLYHHSVFNPKTGSQSESIAKKIKLKSVSESKSENKDKNPKCTLM